MRIEDVGHQKASKSKSLQESASWMAIYTEIYDDRVW